MVILTLPTQGTRSIETRIFMVIMVFSIISGVQAAIAVYLPIIFYYRFGWSAVEFGLFQILWISLQYLFSPILFFVVLYVTCGGPLLNRIASALMSLIFGSLVGYVIGSIVGSVVVATQVGQPTVLFASISSLPQHVAGQTLMGFAVLAFSDINMKWRRAVWIEELQKVRPVGVTLLAVIYVIFALLNTVAVPILVIYASIIGSSPIGTLVVITLGVVFGMVIVGQLVVAAGLYYGKKWGWVIAVISSASSLVISLLTVGVMVGPSSSMGTFMLLLMPFTSIIGLVIDLVVLFYLLSFNVRRFFGFVNPPAQVQDKPTGAESA